MRIRITDWKKFEEVNKIYGCDVRNRNFSDESEVYAIFRIKHFFKNKVKLLICIDSYSHFDIFYIKQGDYYEVIDDSFSDDYVKLDNFISYYEDKAELGTVKLKIRDIIAKRWIIEDKEFLAKVEYWCSPEVVEEFLKNEMIE